MFSSNWKLFHIGGLCLHTSSEKTGSLVFLKESIIFFGVGTETQVVQSQVVMCA